MASYLDDVLPIDRLEIAGVPVFVFGDPSSDDSRFTYQWLDHGIQGFIDGADREPIERWVRAYLAIPKLGENETAALHANLTDGPGFGYADYDPASTTGDLLAPLRGMAYSAHKVTDADGKFGLLVLAETDAPAPLLEMMSALNVDVVDETELGEQRVQVLEGFSDGIDGRGFIWTESGMSGSLSTNVDGLGKATRFLEAFLQS